MTYALTEITLYALLLVTGLLPSNAILGGSASKYHIPRQQPKNEVGQDFYVNKLDMQMMLSL
ncbi:hypothetical protein F8S20_08050 [Nostoc sp. BAE]|nr:hypothetical protein [Nostoc commune BAE]